jgi:hypothetical protein
MTDQAWLIVLCVALVAAMWASASVSERIGLWRQERKARREKAARVERWLVTRLQMGEYRHRQGVDNGDGF